VITKILPNLPITRVSGSFAVADNLVKTLCNLPVDLRALPKNAFVLKNGNRGQYYQVVYNLALRFGPELTFEFRYGETVIEKIVAQYD
jgi:hypothetical protein